ncbi:MAG: hypothetical protein DMG40_08740 [Acidobacteria bacterium]|nr:MAG: hypothetical protein DMG40_08740 [Acidobacteriota bacterium]
MLAEGRKQPRTPDQFVVQISAVHDPLLTDTASVENLSSRGARVATERFWEPGSPVDVSSTVRELSVRARVVYCHARSPKGFAVGLDFLTPASDRKE